ncbi:hypothetical protein AB0N61_15765 [Microbacterium sp. NPDC089320]|uniref:hypothetical protein n=1 Tax=Microbacterium sp. NPDC089320 TaxID=3155182 RepID=UPI00343F4934
MLELADDRPADAEGSGRQLWTDKRVAAWEKRIAMIAKQRGVVSRRRSAVERATPRGLAAKEQALAKSENRLQVTLRASSEKATDYVESLLVRFLVGSERRHMREQIRYLLEVHSGPVLAVLRSRLRPGSAESDAFLSGVADSHLWCGLLAAAAATLKLDELNARDAANAFFSTPAGLSFDDIDAISETVAETWSEHEGSVVRLFNSQDELTRCARIAAMFICPAPESHGFVLDHAVLPLVQDLLSEAPLIAEALPSLDAR